jgi:hypothetical protein
MKGFGVGDEYICHVFVMFLLVSGLGEDLAGGAVHDQ